MLAGVLAACGVDSAPGSPAGAGATGRAAPAGPAVAVTLTDEGCTATPLTVAAGTVTFTVTSTGGGRVTEVELMRGSRILGERENIVPGITGRFSVPVTAGSYTLNCPGGSGSATQPFTVTP